VRAKLEDARGADERYLEAVFNFIRELKGSSLKRFILQLCKSGGHQARAPVRELAGCKWANSLAPADSGGKLNGMC